MISRFSEKIRKFPDGCWMWEGSKFNTGYGAFWYKGQNRLAHRLAYEWLVGPIPQDLVVRHRCNVPDCVNPCHLIVGTQAENIADRDRAGTTYRPRGEKNVNAKVSGEQVRVIRQRFFSGEEKDSLAHFYGVSPKTIYKIVTRRSWGHI
jgi:hypothetical protein